jgi:transposase
MERCPDCNALLRRDEKACVHCGAVNQGRSVVEILSFIAKAAFWLSFLLLAASPFVERAPDWRICLMISGALLLVHRALSDDSFRIRRR